MYIVNRRRYVLRELPDDKTVDNSVPGAACPLASSELQSSKSSDNRGELSVPCEAGCQGGEGDPQVYDCLTPAYTGDSSSTTDFRWKRRSTEQLPRLYPSAVDVALWKAKKAKRPTHTSAIVVVVLRSPARRVAHWRQKIPRPQKYNALGREYTQATSWNLNLSERMFSRYDNCIK